ncbi:neprosin family prolyl endopeptidase [Paractinoplanes hotanensis]|uniref:Neprosin family prolyl endopeptidase n=1 Tax=Paractinoplanes hotanensis TaxID=2906497 RepID=A0ABT0Y0A0_9ACTN|nr:neprosin family prolyl endopeptidase [Actinoplanes hotanensis]MCM4079463.1 neprosin family prolyl endopeptidase [Actinoplanes hotanensis]
MLKSRRGLLAAGLAVAVVGAIGVVSTVSAGADQIATPPEASAAAGVADDSPDADAVVAGAGQVLLPPPVLPWGDRPKRIKKGRNGVTSKTLRAEGLSAAAPDTTGSLVPRARYGPKGRSGGNAGVIRTEQTDAVPPKPLGVKAAANNVNYLYNVGSQAADTSGIFANVTIGKPDLDRNDYHTLAEVALQSADGEQIVEIGWTVDRLVNGDDDPHLFVFHWVNGEPTCYNKCGFVQVSPTVKPGATLTYGITKKFGIQYFKDAWWVAYDTEWIGYFPETNWTAKGVEFNRSGYLQVFGEVAASREKPCGTAMGNGTGPEKDTSARFSSVGFVDGPAVDLYMRSFPDKLKAGEEEVPFYKVKPVVDESVEPPVPSKRSFRYGGPARPTGLC